MDSLLHLFDWLQRHPFFSISLALFLNSCLETVCKTAIRISSDACKTVAKVSVESIAEQRKGPPQLQGPASNTGVLKG